MPSLKAGNEVVLFSPLLRRFVKVNGAAVGATDTNATEFPNLGALLDAEDEADEKKEKREKAKDALEDARKDWKAIQPTALFQPAKAKAAKEELEEREKKYDKAKDNYADADKKRDKLRKKYADFEPARFKLVDAGGGKFNLKNADAKCFLRLIDGKATTVDKSDKQGCDFVLADVGGFTTLQASDTKLFLRMKDTSTCDAATSASDASMFQVQVSGQPLAALGSLQAAPATPQPPAAPVASRGALIVDAGTSQTRYALAQPPQGPIATYPSVVGRPRSGGLMVGSTTQSVSVGDEAIAKRALLTLKAPLDHGVVVNWPDATELYRFASTAARVTPDAQPLVATDHAVNPDANREQLTRVAFETLNVPAFYVGNDAALALRAYGLKTGVVVNAGASVTMITPVVEGKVLKHAVMRMDVGGADATGYLLKILGERGYPFTTTEERETANEIKEKQGFVTAKFDDAMNASGSDLERKLTLPSGQIITIDKERFRCAEVLFQPSLIGMETEGVHKSTYQAVMKCDPSVRADLFANVVLVGGSTLFDGFKERLVAELDLLRPPSMQVTVKANPNRRSAVALGAAALAREPDFASRCISAAEYASAGAAIVKTKCAI